MKRLFKIVAGILILIFSFSFTLVSQVKGDENMKLLIAKSEGFLQKNELDSALFYCNAAFATGMGSCKLYDLRGIIYTKMQKYNKAIKEFKTAIELDSTCYESYNHLGIVYLCRNELELAIESFNRSIELNPSYAKAYYNRGITKLYLHDTDEALTDMKKAADLNYNEAIKFLHELN